MEEEAPKCCICGGAYKPGVRHGSLHVHVEQIDAQSTATVLSAVQVGGCCDSACLTELLSRLARICPNGCYSYNDELLDALSTAHE